jgi:hypothetical protein
LSTFSDRITSLESEVSRSLDPASCLDAIAKIEADLDFAFSTTQRWISRSLLSEPILYSNDLGNLVLLESRLQRIREGLQARGIQVTENPRLRSLAEELNLHYARVSELAAPLASLRRRSYRSDSPLRRIAALRRMRRDAPREQRYLHEQTAIEAPFATWLEEDRRTDEEYLAASAFFETYRPQTGPLIAAERIVRERVLVSRCRFATAKAEACLDNLHRSEESDTPHALQVAIKLLTEGLEKKLLLEPDKWATELKYIEARFGEIQGEISRKHQASLALAALERNLDERRNGRAVEATYAEARRLQGDLGPELEARVRRRLGIEKSLRLRRTSGLILVGCVILAGITLLAVYYVQQEKREQAVLAIVEDGQRRIASNAPHEVERLVAKALQIDSSLEVDPRITALRVDADTAVSNRDAARSSSCAAIDEIASSAEEGLLGVDVGRTRIQDIVSDLSFPNDLEIQTCQSDAMRRLDDHEAILIDESTKRLTLAIVLARSKLQKVVDTWPEDRGQSVRIDPNAWKTAGGSSEMAALDLQSDLDHSPEVGSLRSLQQEASAIHRELTERATKARSRLLELNEGFAAIKKTSQPVRTEAGFLDSVKQVALENASFLQMIGRYREIERALEIAESLPSLKTWRDDFVADVLDGNRKSSTIAAKSKSLDRIDEFQRRFPRSPLRNQLEEFRSFLELDGILEPQQGGTIAQTLDDTGLDDLRRMMTADGWLYARPKTSRSLLYYILTIGDLTENPDALSTVPPSQYPVILRPVRSEASAAMAQGIARLRKASGLEASDQLLNLIASVRSVDDPDWHLQLAILDAAWSLWIERFAGLGDVYTGDARDWLNSLHRENRSVVMSDWISDSPARKKRPGSARDARVLVNDSPDPTRILRAVAKSRLEVLDQLQPVLLVGILLPTSSDRMPREIRWLDDIAIEEDLLVPIMTPDGPTLVEAVIDRNGRLEPHDGLVTEAIPLFRRGVLRENSK